MHVQHSGVPVKAPPIGRCELRRVMFAEPGVEQLAFMPPIDGARRSTREVWRLAGTDELIVADDGGEVVGFAWQTNRRPSCMSSPRGSGTGWDRVGRAFLGDPQVEVG
jgi:hypothetical protein